MTRRVLPGRGSLAYVTSFDTVSHGTVLLRFLVPGAPLAIFSRNRIAAKGYELGYQSDPTC